MRTRNIFAILFGLLFIAVSGCARTEIKNPVHPEPVYIEPTEEEVLIASRGAGTTDRLPLSLACAGAPFNEYSELNGQLAHIERYPAIDIDISIFPKSDCLN